MSKFKDTIICFLPLTSLLLASCNIYTFYETSPKLNLIEWHNHRHSLSSLTAYQIRGSLIYLSNEYKIYVRLNLQQTNKNKYHLILTNIFGSTIIDLRVQSNLTQLTNQRGNYYISDNPEKIIQKSIGISIPLINLRQWILGLPGNATSFTLNSHGYLHILHYNYNKQHWIVTYQNYYNNTIPPLPSSIELRQNMNYIKLKIDNWNLQ